MWEGLVEIVVHGTTALASIYGGSLGAAVLTMGFGVRLLLLPLTLHLAERTRHRSRALALLKPELEAARARHAADPVALQAELVALHERHGLALVDGRGLVGGLVQLPLLGAAFAAVRRLAAGGASFHWIANLSAPDLLVAVAVSLLTFVSASLTAEGPGGRVLPALVALVVFVVVSRMMAGIGLYMAASASVGVLQAVLVRARGR